MTKQRCINIGWPGWNLASDFLFNLSTSFTSRQVQYFLNTCSKRYRLVETKYIFFIQILTIAFKLPNLKFPNYVYLKKPTNYFLFIYSYAHVLDTYISRIIYFKISNAFLKIKKYLLFTFFLKIKNLTEIELNIFKNICITIVS